MQPAPLLFPPQEIEHAKYLYSKELKDDNPELEYNRKLVATNASAVHIPTDIYRGRNDILNQLTWTQQVDQQFISMAANEEYFNDTVRYMYLATDMGLMRLYPGMKWTQLEGVTSMYDARRTS
uniref:VWA_N domain-containing protein n=1 Tax=Macrostomum lignano TaxID=282301 RepID=A0A1I8IDD9_9PLAT